MAGSSAGAYEAYRGLSTPAFITDADYRIVYLNPRAEALWGIRLEEVAGQIGHVALHLGPPEDIDISVWINTVVSPALTTGDSFPCRTTTPDGHARIIHLNGTRFFHNSEWHFLVTVRPETEAAHRPEPSLDWALNDPLTGLYNRHQWEREFADRNARPGTVVFFDLDGLKEINDLAGHRRGDQALLMTGRALAACVPEGALLVRFGGDEFVVVMDEHAEALAETLGERVVAAAHAAAQEEAMPFPLQLSFGVATFEPGGLLDAVDMADQALYERKGVLMRGTGEGRIVFTHAGRQRVLIPGGESVRTGAGAFATGFGREFDGHFRRMFARAVQQAVEFVEAVAPEPGSAVVEVGAGSGRITFDGGLAERIGPRGQLLVTDASAAQLEVARQRAGERGLSWIRFMVAPAEELPIASDVVDLVLGALFLHFTDEGTAIRSMARITRHGGRVALNTALGVGWGPGWRVALEPVREALAEHGRPYRDPFLPREELERLVTEAGLTIEKAVLPPEDHFDFADADLAVAVIRQGRTVPLLLRGVPAPAQRQVQEAVERRLRRAVGELGPSSATLTFQNISLVARKKA